MRWLLFLIELVCCTGLMCSSIMSCAVQWLLSPWYIFPRALAGVTVGLRENKLFLIEERVCIYSSRFDRICNRAHWFSLHFITVILFGWHTGFCRKTDEPIIHWPQSKSNITVVDSRHINTLPSRNAEYKLNSNIRCMNRRIASMDSRTCLMVPLIRRLIF